MAAAGTLPDRLLRIYAAYARVFELHGWQGVLQRLTELQRAGDIAGMPNTITGYMLDV